MFFVIKIQIKYEPLSLVFLIIKYCIKSFFVTSKLKFVGAKPDEVS